MATAGLLLAGIDSIACEFRIHEEISRSDEEVGGEDETHDQIDDENHLIAVGIPNFLYGFLHLGLDELGSLNFLRELLIF
jgi:hypothetical protein